MTDREKAIVMAYTEICMLTGDKFQVFHKYIEDILGRPVTTHELAFLADVIKKRSKADFIELCKDGSDSIEPLEQEPCEDAPDINDGNIYKCSCGYGWDKSKVVRHHFCPNCGRAVDNSIPCDDAVSRQAVLELVADYDLSMGQVVRGIHVLPPVTPQYTNEEIQKMQDLEQAELEKAYELGKAEIQPCEDCISSQEVLDEMYKRKADGDAITAGFVKNLQPVTPQPKVGRWLAKSFHEVYCDNCGFDFDIMANEFIDKMKYCPNCGQKMEVKG